MSVLKKHKENLKKHSPRVQTTCLVSLGPVFVITAIPILYFIIRIYVIRNEKLISIKYMKKKKLTKGPTDTLMRLMIFHLPNQANHRLTSLQTR